MLPKDKYALSGLFRGLSAGCGFLALIGLAIGWNGLGWLVMAGLVVASIVLLLTSIEVEK